MKKNFTILAIDTSCDETAAAVTINDTVQSNVIFSQVAVHKKWGGVVPMLAKREHEKRIAAIVDEAIVQAQQNIKRYQIQKSNIKNQNERSKFKIETAIQEIDAIAVTVGPGLAPALEVGIRKAKELAKRFNKPLISVNHMEGHLLSP